MNSLESFAPASTNIETTSFYVRGAHCYMHRGAGYNDWQGGLKFKIYNLYKNGDTDV